MPTIDDRTVILSPFVRKLVLSEIIRVVVLPAYKRDRSTNLTSIKWPEPKDPNEKVDFTVDWSKRLDTGDTIETTTFTVTEGTVTVDSSSASGKIATVWLTGGSSGEVCPVLNRIITVGGREMEQTILLEILSK